MRATDKLTLGSGTLYMGPRPSFERIREKTLPANTIVCLQKYLEMKGINDQYSHAGYKCVQFPLSAWDIRYHNDAFSHAANFVVNELDRGEQVYVHCRQGIHRTTTLALNVLRLKGYTYEQALQLISQARPLIWWEYKGEFQES